MPKVRAQSTSEMPGFESTMVYWTDVLYERPDPDLAAFEKGAGFGVAKSPEGHHGIRFRKSDSHQTRPWREPDSNRWSPGSSCAVRNSRWRNCSFGGRRGVGIGSPITRNRGLSTVRKIVVGADVVIGLSFLIFLVSQFNTVRILRGNRAVLD